MTFEAKIKESFTQAFASLQLLNHATVRCSQRFIHRMQLRQKPQHALEVFSEQIAILRRKKLVQARSGFHIFSECDSRDINWHNCRRGLKLCRVSFWPGARQESKARIPSSSILRDDCLCRKKTCFAHEPHSTTSQQSSIELTMRPIQCPGRSAHKK